MTGLPGEEKKRDYYYVQRHYNSIKSYVSIADSFDEDIVESQDIDWAACIFKQFVLILPFKIVKLFIRFLCLREFRKKLNLKSPFYNSFI